jgi:hypothetical protein
MTSTRTCPKCGRDFSKDPCWSANLPRHLARKNPCDRDPSVAYVRKKGPPEKEVFPEFNALKDVEWVRVPRPRGIPMHDITPWFFKQIFDNPKNECFVIPNISRNMVLVKLTKDKDAEVLTLDELIKEFVNRVLQKHFNFDNEPTFVEWLSENYISTVKPWNGVYPDVMYYKNSQGKNCKSTPEFMIHMRRTIRVFASNQEDKGKIKRKLKHGENPETS